ncbi:hypothetical protein OIU74_015917, partial [Salix koriyanagi]
MHIYHIYSICFSSNHFYCAILNTRIF